MLERICGGASKINWGWCLNFNDSEEMIILGDERCFSCSYKYITVIYSILPGYLATVHTYKISHTKDRNGSLVIRFN